MDSIKTWFNTLSSREQKLVSIAAFVVVFCIFYFVVWAPLNSALEKSRNEVSNNENLLAYVQEQANRAVILRQSGNRQVFSGSLTQIVNQTTRRASIPVARMQPQGEELIVTIDSVEFNRFVRWVASLEQQGVRIVQSDVSELDVQGHVQVRRLQLGK